MLKHLIIGIGVLALLPLAGCQRLARLPQMLTTAPASAPVDASASTRSTASGALQERTMEFGGVKRRYFVHVPKSASSGKPMPLVVALHGGGARANGFVDRLGLIDMADRLGMILVAPQGLSQKGDGGSWNANSIVPSGFAERSGVDDVGFIDAVVREISVEQPVDSARIYAVGMSKGGMMAYRVACVLPGRFTAIAAVASTLSAADCPNARGVSVLHIHGTDDQNVTFEGGQGEFTNRTADWPAVSRGLDFFRTGNQCSTQTTTTRPASDTTCTVQSCSGDEVVELCLIDRGGHAWPGSAPTKRQLQRRVYVSKEFNATDYIGRFLMTH